MRPTLLGNTLMAGEQRAGARYRLTTSAVWPRLVRLLPAEDREQIAILRNQLDAAARLCALALLAVPATGVLLIRYDVWLFVPLACYVFAWLAYRACVSAARRFSIGLAVMFDLHHLLLWEVLSLQRPANLSDERDRAPAVSRLLADVAMTDAEIAQIAYQQAD